jgi:hypothetical protein
MGRGKLRPRPFFCFPLPKRFLFAERSLFTTPKPSSVLLARLVLAYFLQRALPAGGENQAQALYNGGELVMRSLRHLGSPQPRGCTWHVVAWLALACSPVSCRPLLPSTKVVPGRVHGRQMCQPQPQTKASRTPDREAVARHSEARMDEHPASFDSNSSEASPDASLDANAQVWSAKIQAAATDRQTEAQAAATDRQTEAQAAATDRQTEAQLKAAEITAGATDRQTGATDRQTVVQTVAMTAFSLFGIGWTELKAYSPFVLAVLLTGTIWKRELLRDVYKDIVLFLRATIAPQLWPRGGIAENKTTIDRAASMGTDITRDDCDFDSEDEDGVEKELPDATATELKSYKQSRRTFVQGGNAIEDLKRMDEGNMEGTNEFLRDEDAALAAAGWVEISMDNGAGDTYWTNLFSKETVWQRPALVDPPGAEND